MSKKNILISLVVFLLVALSLTDAAAKPKKKKPTSNEKKEKKDKKVKKGAKDKLSISTRSLESVGRAGSAGSLDSAGSAGKKKKSWLKNPLKGAKEGLSNFFRSGKNGKKKNGSTDDSGSLGSRTSINSQVSSSSTTSASSGSRPWIASTSGVSKIENIYEYEQPLGSRPRIWSADAGGDATEQPLAAKNLLAELKTKLPRMESTGSAGSATSLETDGGPARARPIPVPRNRPMGSHMANEENIYENDAPVTQPRPTQNIYENDAPVTQPRPTQNMYEEIWTSQSGRFPQPPAALAEEDEDDGRYNLDGQTYLTIGFDAETPNEDIYEEVGPQTRALAKRKAGAVIRQTEEPTEYAQVDFTKPGGSPLRRVSAGSDVSKIVAEGRGSSDSSQFDEVQLPLPVPKIAGSKPPIAVKPKTQAGPKPLIPAKPNVHLKKTSGQGAN